MPLIPVIAGPTASGKTAVAVELAKLIDGEIISADSMQVYQHLTIGTAKPTPEELQGVPCHLIDHVSPNDQYNLGRFVREAEEAMAAIQSRGRIPILCGGTGMYIRGLLHGVFSGGEPDPAIRAGLEKQAEADGLAPLFAELQQTDPASAEKYGPHDRQRILRALEVIRATGRPFSSFHDQDKAQPRFPTSFHVLEWPRTELYRRIDLRVDRMVDAGLLDEVRQYLAAGFRRDNPAMSALGYAELIAHVEGRLTLEEALDTMKRKSRNYAKRQLTWFRAVEGAQWLDMSTLSPTDAASRIFRALRPDAQP